MFNQHIFILGRRGESIRRDEGNKFQKVEKLPYLYRIGVVRIFDRL